MNLELNTDQKELAAIGRGVLDRHAPLATARAFLDGRGDATPLADAIRDLGWYAIGVEEGDPFGTVGLCLLSYEVGAHVAPALLVDTALVAHAAAESPKLAHIAAGEIAVTLAVPEPVAGWSRNDVATTAITESQGVTLNGTKIGVRHPEAAQLLAVLARLNDELGIFLVPPGAPGVEISGPGGMDPSTGSATVTLTNVHVGDDARVECLTAAELERLFAVGAVATAAESVGAAAKLLDLAVKYAMERKQFGRAIGSFQAVQHLLAEAHVLQEASWSTILYAAAALDEDLVAASDAPTIAKAYVSRAAREVAERSLQVLGGIAFTWEHDAHLFQRRVIDCERRFGDSVAHERAIGERMRAGSGVTS